MDYLVLDFGGVLMYPVTGYWFITPYLLDIINKREIDLNAVLSGMDKYNYILSRRVVSMEEEAWMFFDFYRNIFSFNDDEIWNIACDITYSLDKYALYDGVFDELSNLFYDYKLLLLSDNWPCGIRIMKQFDIYDFFDKVYISSIYGMEKKGGAFFDVLLDDYSASGAKFVDDNESLLDVALLRGFDVFQMDREKSGLKSKHLVINNLRGFYKGN